MITQAETSSSAPVEVAAIPGIPFGRLLRVEWSKAVDTRAARWLIAISALATVGIMLAPALAEHSINQTYGNYLGFPALVATTLMPILAVLTMTTEWTQRTVLTTFTQEPRRGRVVTAKVGASLLLGALTAAFVGAVTAVTIWVVEAGGRHLHDRLGPAEMVGFAVFVLLNMLMAVGFGAALQNTAAAIVLLFVLPIGFGLLGDAAPVVRKWLDPSAVFNFVYDGSWNGHILQILVGCTLWIALPLTFGVVRTLRREIK